MKKGGFWAFVGWAVVEFLHALVLQGEELLAAKLLRAIVAWVQRAFGGQHGFGLA